MHLRILLTCWPLAACLASGDRAPPQAAAPRPAERIETLPARPEDAPADACWAQETRDATVAVELAEMTVEPPGLAPDGTLREAPITRIERRETVVRPAAELWFDALCPGELGEARIAALQRALAARDLHDGPVTGRLDQATREAVRAYQTPRGLDSGTLSRAAARQMGLVTVAAPAGE
ncbi:peptidoglycan-binding protein [Rhodovulum sp. 12E13]|uniref:peptidoglycan-binding protein n=1 Tax=Rhodovulum sp. 12E13 TaxID=2203891 RepID=UPI000E19A443|nr:peptidoglycan-binding protein [Rhodovulum sp. 12E13]RDC72421.1 peptidoglycan-binding protein [Rhodovulum sp. 12E13]